MASTESEKNRERKKARKIKRKKVIGKRGEIEKFKT
jgi:hypothetical protein